MAQVYEGDFTGSQAFAEATEQTPGVIDVFREIGNRVSESPFGQWVSTITAPARSMFNDGKNALTSYLETVREEAAERGDAGMLGQLQVVGADARGLAQRTYEDAKPALSTFKDTLIGIGERLGINQYIERVTERVREQDAIEGSLVNTMHRGFDVMREGVQNGFNAAKGYATGLFGQQSEGIEEPDATSGTFFERMQTRMMGLQPDADGNNKLKEFMGRVFGDRTLEANDTLESRTTPNFWERIQMAGDRVSDFAESKIAAAQVDKDAVFNPWKSGPMADIFKNAQEAVSLDKTVATPDDVKNINLDKGLATSDMAAQKENAVLKQRQVPGWMQDIVKPGQANNDLSLQ